MITAPTADYTDLKPVTVQQEEHKSEYDSRSWIKKGSISSGNASIAGNASSSSPIFAGLTPISSSASPQPEQVGQKQEVDGNKAAEAILSAYINKVVEITSSWSLENDARLDISQAGEVVRLSENYLKSINSNTQFRIFISTISLTIKNSLTQFNARKISLFQKAITDFQNSNHTTLDNQNFVKSISSYGLSPIRLAE